MYIYIYIYRYRERAMRVYTYIYIYIYIYELVIVDTTLRITLADVPRGDPFPTANPAVGEFLSGQIGLVGLLAPSIPRIRVSCMGPTGRSSRDPPVRSTWQHPIP